jgi:flagellar assembly factor FliW
MQLNTTRFGTLEVNDGDVITFTQPILGFQDQRRFVLLPGPEGSPLKWLQSTESGELAFIVMDPRAVVPDYEVRPGPQEMAELAVKRSGGVAGIHAGGRTAGQGADPDEFEGADPH